MYEIVANCRNSVDVDKFDYLARDCYNVGNVPQFDTSRLMTFSRVIDNEICYHEKEDYNIYKLFETRYSLFKTVYSHRVGTAIEWMVGDALHLANPFLKLYDLTRDLESYTYLTDCILNKIESSKDPELEESRKIIKRIRKRQLYKFSYEYIVPPGDLTWRDPTPADIISYNNLDVDLKEEDIIVDTHTNNFAMAEKNPLDNISFFAKYDQDTKFHIKGEDISLMIPKYFREKYVRLYCRDRNKNKVFAIHNSFENYAKKNTRNFTPSPKNKIPLSKIDKSISPPKFDIDQFNT